MTPNETNASPTPTPTHNNLPDINISPNTEVKNETPTTPTKERDGGNTPNNYDNTNTKRSGSVGVKSDSDCDQGAIEEHTAPEVNTLNDNSVDEITLADMFTANGASRGLKKSLVNLSKKDSGDTARNQIYNVYQSIRKEGATDQQAVDEIMAHLPKYYGVGGGDRSRDLRRSIEDSREMYEKYVGAGFKDAVVDLTKLSSLDRIARTPRYKADDDLIGNVAPELVGSGSDVPDMLNEIRQMMGDNLKGVDRTGETFLENRYASDDLICLGETSEFITAQVSEIIKAGKGGLERPFSTKEKRLVNAGITSTQLVASPMKSIHGTTKAGRETMKSRGNCGVTRYVVFEIDDERFKPLKEDSDAEVKDKLKSMMASALPRIKYLMGFVPLVDILYSGSKSPHACFDVSKLSEAELGAFLKTMMRMGGDAICRLPEQFYRMGGAMRKTKRGAVKQTIYAIGRSKPTRSFDELGEGGEGENDCATPSHESKSDGEDSVIDDFEVVDIKKGETCATPKKSKAAGDVDKSKLTDPLTNKLTRNAVMYKSFEAEIRKITPDTWDAAIEATAELCYSQGADVVVVSAYLVDQAKVIGKSYTKAEVKSVLNSYIKKIRRSAHAVGNIPTWGKNYVFVGDEDKFVNFKSFTILAPTAVDRSHLYDSENDGYEQPASRVLLKIEEFPKCETMDFRPDRYDRHNPAKSRVFKDRQKGNQKTLNTFHELFYPKRDTNKKRLKRAKFLIKRHLRNYLSKEDTLTMLDWLAYAVQNAGQRMSWMPVIQSGEGAGKGLTIGLLRAVTMPSHIALVSPLAFHSDYSDYNEGKIIIAYDEFNMTDKRGVSAKDDFKNNITEENLTVNRKGGRMLEVPNISKKIAFTNDLNCMEMSATDRRFCMIKSHVQSEADVARLNPMHFEEYCDEILDANTGTLAGAAREYLLSYDIRGSFDPLGRAPDTAYRRELVEESKSREYRVIAELLKDDKCEFVTKAFISVTQIHRVIGWFDPKNHIVNDALNALGYTKFDAGHGFTNAPKGGRVGHVQPAAKTSGGLMASKTKHTMYVSLRADKDCKIKNFSQCELNYEYEGEVVEDDFDLLS